MLSEARLRRVLYPLTAAIVLAYFLFFTWRSVHLYFDQDDMLNLYMAWSKPPGEALRALLFYWSDFYRPLGGLFYTSIFAVAGFDPLPFRVICLALGIVNIGICFWFTRLVSGSERIAALSSLLFAFHPRLLEIWYRTATIYDLLCFTLLWLAACLYVWGRSALVAGGIFVLYVAALDSKEIAVCLPVILCAWELLFRRKCWKLIATLIVITLPYIYGKTHGHGPLTGNPFYAAKYTWAQFQGSWTVYLQYIFLRDPLKPWLALFLPGAAMLIALAIRSRGMILAWVIIFFGTLPVSFIPYRGGYALYIAWLGWVLWAATALVWLQDLVLRNHLRHNVRSNPGNNPKYRVALACFVFVLVGWRTGKASLHEQRRDPLRWLYDPPAQIHQMVTEMRALQPDFPAGARMLFADDPFGTDEWTPYFVMKLAWHDKNMVVDRVKMMSGPPASWDGYQYVFTFSQGRYQRLYGARIPAER